MLKPIAFSILLLFVAVAANAQNELSGTVDLAGYRFRYSETPVFQPQKNDAKLQMRYSEAEILNPEAWKPASDITPTTITLVYSKYPVDTLNWQIPYQALLVERLNNLFKIDPSLRNNPAIEWRLAAQNSCRSINQAKALFHGFVIEYQLVEKPVVKPGIKDTIKPTITLKPKPDTLAAKPVVKTRPKTVEELDPIDPTVVESPNMKRVIEIIEDYSSFPDTAVIAAFRRHPEWKDIVAVVDWTASMHPYGAQVMAWHRMRLMDSTLSSIAQLYLFNDGDDLMRSMDDRHAPKIIGKAGGIYKGKPTTTNAMLRLMQQVMSGGDGGEIPENNIEALLKAQKEYPDAPFLLMVADNLAPVRDLVLVDSLKIPVRIILCGNVKYFHPDYLTIAAKTGGAVTSITTELDFGKNPPAQLKPDVYKIGEGEYRRETNGNFQLTTPNLQPMQYSGGKAPAGNSKPEQTPKKKKKR